MGRDDAIEFDRIPAGTSTVLNAFGSYPLADVFSDKYLTQSPRRTRWTPAHARLLTHYLFFTDARRPQLREYFNRRGRGAGPATAAAAFSDPVEQARDVRR